RLALAKRRVGRALQRRLLAAGEIAAMIDERHAVAENQPHRIGHLLRPDEIAPAHLHAIATELAGDAVHQALHREHRRRPARAAWVGGVVVGRRWATGVDGPAPHAGREYSPPRYTA